MRLFGIQADVNIKHLGDSRKGGDNAKMQQ